MDDTISRQAAINTVLNIRQKCDTNDIDEYRDILVECFEELPTAESTTCKYWDTESNFCALYRPSAQSKTNEEAFEEGYTKAQMELKEAYAPRKGKWISETKGEVAILDEFGNVSCSARCSECGDWLTASDEYSCRGNYCPNCGARMEGE